MSSAQMTKMQKHKGTCGAHLDSFERPAGDRKIRHRRADRKYRPYLRRRTPRMDFDVYNALRFGWHQCRTRSATIALPARLSLRARLSDVGRSPVVEHRRE